MLTTEGDRLMGQDCWYVTTPIYYPSADLHIGHAYTTVAADALARYHRLLGERVLFVTGTDEHGQKIERSAAALGVTPSAFVDGVVGRIRDELWPTLAVAPDCFIRTTEPRHERVVQTIFQRLRDQGDIYFGTYEGWYCLPDESFWPDSRVENATCPECGRPVERVRQPSYFFRLSRYQDRLLAYLREHPDFVQPKSRLNEMINFIEQGLEDLSVSRAGVGWGIPVPGDPDHTIYVWFDALINYLTAAGYLEDGGQFGAAWPPDVQLMGKEIVRFHAVTWPIILMALDLPLPRRIFGHGWLLIGDTKIGKSLGNVIDPILLVHKYGVDPIRYFLLREVPFGADGSYTEEALVRRTNVDLANDLGNLLHRTVAMVRRFNDGVVPTFHPDMADPSLEVAAAAAVREVEEALGRLELNHAIEAIGQLVRHANKYIEDRQPWRLFRDPAARERLDNVLSSLVEALRVTSVLLTPFLVETPQRIRQQLGIAEAVAHWNEATWGQWRPGARLEAGTPLFPRLEAAANDQAPIAASPASPSRPEPHAVAIGEESMEEITIEDFGRLDLRVARVEAAERVAGTDRLLQLTLSLGDTTRTVVSGIAQHYQPEALVGQHVVVVANLKPVKLRGIVSQGMVLAASEGGHLALVGPIDPIASGARVK